MNEAAVPSKLSSGPGMTRVLSDDRLARRATQGDKRAFAAIFDRYHQSLYRYCLAIVGNSHDAQDALQNTMVKALRALPGEERHIKLKPWLYRIAHNESIELLRRRRETRQLDPELGDATAGLAEEVASREQLRRLISDLDKLPGRQRGALVMRELAGLDFAEIGAALGTSSAVARQTLYEARLSLRQMDEGREMNCETVTKALSDGDGRVTRRRDIRAHLRACASCRSFGEEIERRQRDLAALSPLPAVAAAGLLQSLIGGNGATGGLAATLGGGAAQSLGSSAAIKGAAAAAVVAVIGVGAADRSGLIDAELPGGGGSQPTREAEQAAGAGPVGARPTHSDSAALDATARSTAGPKGDGHLGASQTTNPGTGKVATPGDAQTTAEAVSGPQGNPAAHSHGKGNEKQLPDASAHGQGTAAGHKTTNHGHAGTQSHPAHPSKPTHPTHPSDPNAEKGPPPPPPSPTAPESHAHGNTAAQAPGDGEASPSPEPEAGRSPEDLPRIAPDEGRRSAFSAKRRQGEPRNSGLHK